MLTRVNGDVYLYCQTLNINDHGKSQSAIQRNYNNAITAAKNSCGSDACIEQAMRDHGYNIDVFEEPTVYDHLKACIIVLTIKTK